MNAGVLNVYCRSKYSILSRSAAVKYLARYEAHTRTSAHAFDHVGQHVSLQGHLAVKTLAGNLLGHTLH
ncbi:hypothetical protein D9M71_839370 [compost metagenome]